MKEHPIIFAGKMVRAILDGRKTQTRRVIKQPSLQYLVPRLDTEVAAKMSPHGRPGDRLWVKETWHQHYSGGVVLGGRPHYRADSECNGGLPWKSSSFMPRWASRITLEITGLRVERVQDITYRGVVAEGVYDFKVSDLIPKSPLLDGMVESEQRSRLRRFSGLWDSINAKRGFGWDDNPWVWVIEFKMLDTGIGSYEDALNKTGERDFDMHYRNKWEGETKDG